MTQYGIVCLRQEVVHVTVHETRGRQRGTRQTYSVVIDPALVETVDRLVQSGRYRSRSHAFESAVRLLITYHRIEVPNDAPVPEEVRNAA